MSKPCDHCGPAPEPASEKIVSHVRVYYPDAVYDDLDWSTLPERGVQVVVLTYVDGTRRIMQGDDVYATWQGAADRVYASTSKERDVDDWPDDAIVLRGAWIDDASFHAIVADALSG